MVLWLRREVHRYDAYRRCRISVASLSSRNSTGKERDTESGLDYFGARYYGSSMGRFMSPDYREAGEEPDAVPYADFKNPQSLNLYSYGSNNPLSQVDSTGHYHCDPDTSSTDTNGVLTVTAGACHADLADYLRFVRTMMRAEVNVGLSARSEAMSYLQVGIVNCPDCQIGIMPWGMTEGLSARGGLGPVLKGAVGVAKAVAEIEAEGGTVIAREVTISNSAGTARVDVVYQDASGELKLGEAKNGPTADLNRNQRAVYGAMKREGARLVGGNASSAGLPSSIGPASVRVFKY
jgi:RHS repeat-associated protein